MTILVVSYLALFITLPSKAASGRTRLWRALKSLGCATLRDGVYLLPDRPEHAQALGNLGTLAVQVQGSAEVYRLAAWDGGQEARLQRLFQRGPEYREIRDQAQGLQADLETLDERSAAKRLRALEKRWEQVGRIDFFPDPARVATRDLLSKLGDQVRRHYSPDEPSAIDASPARLERAAFQGRVWATRARPRIDRLASAWLIQRHIDPQARFVWLARPGDCQPGWLGFDFDGADFSHLGLRVTFQVLTLSFGLDQDPALARLGDLVKRLDLGEPATPEAQGVAAVLQGLGGAIPDDDSLLERAGAIFDGLYQYFSEESAHV